MGDRQIVELEAEGYQEHDERGRLTVEINTDNDDPPGWTGGNCFYLNDETGNCSVRMGWQ